MRRIFYTSLYHTMLAPTLFSDVDGRYRGMDLAVHQLPQGANNYSTYSLWDTYRAQHPLLTLYQPERVPDLVNGLVRMAGESPDGPPVWPLQGVETGCMIGYHSAVVVAEAHAKGFTGIDYAKAWPLFRKRAMDDDYRGLPYYRKLGYIPSDKEGEAVSKTLEYAYDDWAVAHLADAAGAHADATAAARSARATTSTCSTASSASCGRAPMTATGWSRSIRAAWATPRNGATSPNRTRGRRPSSTSTTCTST